MKYMRSQASRREIIENCAPLGYFAASGGNLFQYISKKMQRYTVYYICKLLYMLRVVPPLTYDARAHKR